MGLQGRHVQGPKLRGVLRAPPVSHATTFLLGLVTLFGHPRALLPSSVWVAVRPLGQDTGHPSSPWALCFLPSWREFLVNLCGQCIAKTVDLWVFTLPVLHHCVASSPQGKDSRKQSEDTWAALEGISFSEFRERRLDQ